MEENKEFDLSVPDAGRTSIIKIDGLRSMQQYRKDTIDTFADFIMSSAIIPKDVGPEEARSLAVAGALLKAEYGLCVVAQEAYFIQLGKGKKKRITLDVSYKGLTKKMREYERETGDTLIPGEGTYMSQNGIEALGLDICRKCKGFGKTTYDGSTKKCWNCDGNGKFDSPKVLHYQIKYYSKNAALAAKEIGVGYFPIIGSALWQPCDNVAENKTPQWVVEKNAFKDVIRRLVPITNFGNGSSNNPFSMENGVEDDSAEGIAEMCAQYGVGCDDIYSLAAFARNCVFIADWDSEEQVVAALAALKIDWKLSDESITKYRVFGYKDGEYPIEGTDVLDRDDPVNGILAKNVQLDLGDDADAISKKLFDKPFSKGLARAQMKEIYEQRNI